MTPLVLPTDDDAQDWVAARTTDGLAAARELVDRLRDAPPESALELLRQWDEVSRHLGNVAAAASLLANVHPDEEVRTTCEQAEVDVDRLVTELRQDRALYEVFAAADPPASTRRRRGSSTRRSRTSGARASTSTTRPGRG